MDCNHKKREGINCCGADLTLSQEEIDARDDFLPLFEKSIMDKLPGENRNSEVNRHVLDYFLSKNALTLAYQMAKLAYKMEKEDVETKPEKPKAIDKDVLVELEK